MTDDLRQQQIKALVQMGAKEFTGGDIRAFLAMAGLDSADPLQSQITAQRADYEARRGRKPGQSKLEESALEGGYLDNYLSMLSSDIGLTREQAYFAAWFNAHPQIRQPKTVLGVANFLGVSRQVLYKWQKQEWFSRQALGEWRSELFLKHLANVDRRTIQDAEELTGAPGVAARRLCYEIGLPALGIEGPGTIKVSWQDSLPPGYNSDEVIGQFAALLARAARDASVSKSD